MEVQHDFRELCLRQAKSQLHIEGNGDIPFIRYRRFHLIGSFCTQGCRVDDGDDAGVRKGGNLCGVMESNRLRQL